MIKLNCLNCDAEFETVPSKVRAGNAKYCSRNCYYEYRKKKKNEEKKTRWNCVCGFCGIKFYIRPCQKKIGEGKYCSKQCYYESKKGVILKDPKRDENKRICLHCGDIFYVEKPSRPNRYCSTKCYHVNRKGKPQPQLHTPEAREKNRQRKIGKRHSEEHKEKLSKALKGRVFTEQHRQNLSVANANRDLSIYKRGEEHHWYKDGKSQQTHPPEFSVHIRKVVRDRDLHMCRVCRKSLIGREGVVHHVDGDKHNNDEVNLILVCRKCHGETHNKRNSKNPIINALKSVLYQY